MDFIGPIILILGGILATAGLIVGKKPEAKDALQKLAAYQSYIGIVLLVWGVIDFVRIGIHLFGLFSAIPLQVVIYLAYIVASILLGIMFGMPIVAKLSAGGAEKGEHFARKLAPYQTTIGIVGIVAALLVLFRV